MSERICRFNQSIICGNDANCGSCGWNPEENERRRQEIRQAGTVFGSIGNPLRHIKGEENRTALRRFSGLRRDEMNMAQKLLAVIMVLRDRGWKVHAQLDLQGWGIYVDYIDEGPQFGLLVRLDPIAWSPYMTHQDIAQLIVDEIQDAMDTCYQNFNPAEEG